MPDPRSPGRRSVLLAVLGLAGGALPVPKSDAVAFRLIRHGSEIGRHSLTFDRAGDNLTVRIVVDALVTLVSIPLVRYTHRGTETWRGNTLAGLRAETNKNGDHEHMAAERSDEGLLVSGSKTERYIAPSDALPTSYWNKHMLDVPMISLEDGKLLRPKIEDRGAQDIRIAPGTTIKTTHYNISGAFDADVFYDVSNAWAGMAVTVADGSEVRYERL